MDAVMRLCTLTLGILVGLIVGALLWAPRPAAGKAPTVPRTEGYDWAPVPLPISPLRTPAPSLRTAPATPSPATRKEPAQVAVPETAKPSPGHTVRGTATWYCGRVCTRGYPGGLYAAAGSELRTGNWRGRRVTVCAGERCVVVELVDTCRCRGERVIDLYAAAFRRLAPLSRGVVAVTVR